MKNKKENNKSVWARWLSVVWLSLFNAFISGIIIYYCVTELNELFVTVFTQIKNGELSALSVSFWGSIIFFIISATVYVAKIVIRNENKKSR